MREDSPSMTSGAVADAPAPLGLVSRSSMKGRRIFRIPAEAFKKIRTGRVRRDEWMSELESLPFASRILEAASTGVRLVLQCEETDKLLSITPVQKNRT